MPAPAAALMRSAPQLRRFLQSLNHSLIGSRELVIVQFGRRNPFEGRTAQGPRFVLSPAATKESQPHRFFRIRVGQALEQLPDFNLDAELLAQFANQALLQSFTRLKFAARKFPKTAQMRLGMPLRDQQLALAKN